MKTIKYLADGTIAKVGMRVKVNNIYGLIEGTIFAINPSYRLFPEIPDNTCDDGVIVRISTLVNSDLFRERGLMWAKREDCTPIK